jgi:seryl-tRNA synthetase
LLDPNEIIRDPEAAAKRLARKGVAAETVQEAVEAIHRRRQVQGKLNDGRAELNGASKEIGRLISAGETDRAEEHKAALATLRNTLAKTEQEMRSAEAGERRLLMTLPNWPADDVPCGTTEADNVLVRQHGPSVEHFAAKEEYRPHWEIATELGIYDAERAAKISGSMFAVLRKDGARLLHALVDYALRLNRDRYEEIVAPHLVRGETFTATGHLPKFADDAYRIASDDLWLIPTGEVPLMSLHRDEIIDGSELPKRYMTYTACFRREAGSAGKDTRGMQRLHEFHKVELVKLCSAEQIQAEFETMLADAIRPLEALGLPYRILDLCAGDLTFSSARIYDLEVYAPGVGRWLEVSSVGQFTDFQARRGNIRYRDPAEKRPRFVHALNGSAMATPRVWAAIIEHGQQPDGSVLIPEVLQPFMGKDRITA